VHFGVQVVDINTATPAAVKIGNNETHFGDTYVERTFDLSAYVNKEVIIAVGIYRMETGDYWKQLPIRRMIFTPTASPDIAAPAADGTEVVGLEGWKLTQEAVRSIMVNVNPNKSFTGITPLVDGVTAWNKAESHKGYRSWREINHVAANWAFVRNPKDPEPFAGEGYVIKTASSADVSTTVPHSYLMAKFAITAGNNQLTLKTRTSTSSCCAEGRYTYFKLTAITEAGVATHIAPATSSVADDLIADSDGCWKLKHTKGTKDTPEDYASIAYDLSQFNGSNVLLCLSVYNGAANTSENKLFIYSISLE
jgi:hypothetical protein